MNSSPLSKEKNDMIEFLESIIAYQFLQRALLAALLCSVAFGITGPFIVKNRLTFLAGGIAHAVMGGIGAAYFFRVNTTIGAIIAAILFSLILTLSRSETNRNEDTIISTLWAAGMSLGVIFIYLTPGYTADLTSFIFGNILMVKSTDLLLMLLLDTLIVILVTIFYYHFVYLSFDEDFLSLRSRRIKLIYFIMLSLISITVVITIKIVGLILVIALVTLPAVIAGLFTRSMRALFAASIMTGIVLSTGGIFIAFVLNIPASASIILLASGIYFLALGAKKVFAG